MSVLVQPAWPLPAAVRLGWTRRLGGDSQAPFDAFNIAHHVGESAQVVDRNRQVLLAALPGCQQIRWLSQVHGTRVVDAVDCADGDEADAVVCREPGTACNVMTADCLPVFFWSDRGDTVACAHAGWRGLAHGVLLETLAQFTQAERVNVGFGPAIGPQAFEVGEDVLNAFADWPGAESCFTARQQPGKFLADLVGLAQSQLAKRGVRQFHYANICTLTDSGHYYSYRRDGQTGRMANLIWIHP